MPKELHDKLAREADKKGLKGKRRSAYIYGTMRDAGWKPKRERKDNPTPAMRNNKMREISKKKGVNLVRS